MKILVVDDEPSIRQIARELLTCAGYDVLEASDGEPALALARKEQPDLILLDLVMPEMDGFQFVLEIGKDPRVRNTPILILSVLVSGVDTDAYIEELDVAGFIDKTQMATSLISRVQEVLSKQAHDVVKSTSSDDSVDKAERKKILVVDDDPTIGEIVREFLTTAGYDILEASDGREALVLAYEKQPDLILLDIMMPGMSGIDVARKIRQQPCLKNTPILIISGCVPESDANDLLGDLKVAGYLSKLEIVTSLLSRVQEILSKQAHDVVKSTSSDDSVDKAERKKILVVDDEPSIRQIVRELLTCAGYDVLEASDGEQALELARMEHPDLILLDLLMPKMNGFQFVLEIRKDPKVGKTPILVLSGVVSGSHTDANIHNLDVAGFIGKTQMVTSLISRVQEILSKQARQVA